MFLEVKFSMSPSVSSIILSHLCASFALSKTQLALLALDFLQLVIKSNTHDAATLVLGRRVFALCALDESIREYLSHVWLLSWNDVQMDLGLYSDVFSAKGFEWNYFREFSSKRIFPSFFTDMRSILSYPFLLDYYFRR
jgi:hypothetical protein